MDKFEMTHYEFLMSETDVHSVPRALANLEPLLDTNKPGFKHFSEVINDGGLQAVSNYIPYELSSMSQMNMSIRILYHCWRMTQWENKIYHIQKDVCQLLNNTKLTIDASFIESPFEEIYLDVDQEELTLTDHTGTRPIKGIYVNLQIDEGKKDFRMLMTTGSKGIDLGLDIQHYVHFVIPESGDVEEACKKQIEGFKKVPTLGHEPNPYLSANSKVLTDAFKLAVNVLVYIGCKDASMLKITPETEKSLMSGMGKKARPRTIKRKLAGKSQYPFIWIGHKEYCPSPGNSRGGGKKLDHRTLVPGYWRGQWYGSKKDDTREKKVIRVSSYTKGKQYKKGEDKSYIVK